MKVIVVYDTRFGNTETIAKALDAGLRKVGGIETTCMNVRELTATTIDSLSNYDLVCIGAPTEGFTASKSMKAFLDRLKHRNYSDKYGFAFDTRVDWRLSGSAAKSIEKAIVNQGFRRIAPRDSAIVSTTKTGGAITGATLKEGEAKRFEQIGEKLAGILAGTHLAT